MFAKKYQINMKDEQSSAVQIIINDIMYQVTEDIPSDMSLNTFIRNVIELKGTKSMCHEGGCGICIVTAEIRGQIMSVNSCLIPVIICDGWKITTIEKVGNRKSGYHELQIALAESNGTQCGFCSPGWIMSMFSLLSNGELSKAEIENSFASNLCRCTGYRSILNAFKKFGIEDSFKLEHHIPDIEDLYDKLPCSNCSFKNVTHEEMEIIYISSAPRTLKLNLSNSKVFHKVLSIDEIFNVFENINGKSYKINGGNTSHGVYRDKELEVIIDINDVFDLQKIVKEDDTLVLGANVTLTNAKIAFEKYAEDEGFHYMKCLAQHFDLIASIPIRNVGTLAGNLMIKNQHHEFPSDVFLTLETAGAKLHILSSPKSKTIISLLGFLSLDMRDKLIYSVVFPQLSKEYVYRSYKITPRAQNAHAIVNAGFLFKLDKDGTVLEKPNMIFCGISSDFLHAVNTEQFLMGKSIFNVEHLMSAFEILKSEISSEGPSSEFYKLICLNLFYKFVLSIDSQKVKPKLKSGGSILQREISSAVKIDYKKQSDNSFINKPIPNIDGINQVSGEIEYTNDISIKKNEVFCVFTLAESLGVVETIDFEEALNLDGVLDFITAKDIPGKNAFIDSDNKNPIFKNDEILLAEDEISYVGQPYGIIVAESQSIAQHAATKVKLNYSKTQKPLITIREVIASNDKSRISKRIYKTASDPLGNDIAHKFNGTFESGAQYHFCMETQTCVCIPVGDTIEVYSATQWMNLIQLIISGLLEMPMNRISMKVHKLGGGFGAKISRSAQVACGCALACFKLNRPARMSLSLEDEMRAIGKRNPSYVEYEVAVDSIGRIQYLNANIWSNVGASTNESCAQKLLKQFINCYSVGRWSVNVYDVRTDVPSNTWCRAPGSVEGMMMIEQILDHIARVADKDSLDVKLLNINDDHGDVLIPMIYRLKNSSDYDIRLENIERFNYNNRWKKKGMSIVLMAYEINFVGMYHLIISIFGKDGTVLFSHGGVEMGQGLNTKLAQIAASQLNVDIKKIKFTPTLNYCNPNEGLTGNSMNTDMYGLAVKDACKIVIDRLEPIKKKLKNPEWEDIVRTACAENVYLRATVAVKPEQMMPYIVYGVAISEVEIDVLTGQHIVHRVDISQDAGEVVLNPLIDAGQVEGGFIMGMGYWTCEDLIYDSDTGVLTNNRTWNYKIPGAKDIPVDFRITFAQKDPNSISENPTGIMKSRTTSEAPICLSCSVPLAIREAINAARSDAGNDDPWYQLDNTVTVDKILLNCSTNIQDMML